MFQTSRTPRALSASNQACIYDSLTSLYSLESIDPHSYSQKVAGPFFLSQIVPWNIQAGCLEYLC